MKTKSVFISGCSVKLGMFACDSLLEQGIRGTAVFVTSMLIFPLPEHSVGKDELQQHWHNESALNP